jgi:MFS family permease
MKVICGTSFMMYGYDGGVLGGLLLHKPFLDAMGNPTGDYVIPMIVASYDLAAAVTAIAIAFFSFKIGRRGTVIMGNAVAIIGAILQASSYSVAQIIVGRLCTGFAIGCISAAVPSYLSETGGEIGDRGPANALNGIFLISGVPIVSCLRLSPRRS